MEAQDVEAHARRLQGIFGPRALYEVAERMRALEAEGNTERAEDLKQIMSALRSLKVPQPD